MASKITLEVVSTAAGWNGEKIIVEGEGEDQGPLLCQTWK